MDTLTSSARAALSTAFLMPEPTIGYDVGVPPAANPLDMKKLSIDVNDTQQKTIVLGPRNASLFHINLKKRIELSEAALWRNPTRTRTASWSRQELMHVFNGWFRQTTLKEWDRYETFGRCYTCPDPFRNDDPPWVACFCR